MTRRILIVDANINFSLKLKKALEDAGYEIRTVTRLKPAVEAVETEDYDIVVVDTDLEFTSPAEIIQSLRAILPRIPALVTGVNPDTETELPDLKAQAFLRKPYLARDLIPLMESVIARGFNPAASEATRENLAQKLANQEKEEQIDPLLEATRQNPRTMLTEPPVTADDSTISEMMNVALKPEVSRKIYAYLDNPEATPEDQNQNIAPDIQPSPDIIPDEPLDAPLDDAEYPFTPVSATLEATMGTDSLDMLLQEIRNYATTFTRSLEAAEKQSGGKTGQINELIAKMEPPRPRSATAPMTPVNPASRIEPMPTDDETRVDIIPPPTRLPDQNWIDSLAEREQERPVPVEVPPQQHLPPIEIEAPPPAIVESAPPPVITPDQMEMVSDEPLVQASIEEVTQRLAVLEMEDLDDLLESEAEEMRITDHVLAHYALQLTQFSMESSSLGAVITRGYDILAQAGDLGDADWDTIVSLINESWNQPGNVRTRVLYRHIDIGEILIYSIQTINELMLTLIFAAETPLKIIRRQAARLTESLKNIPEPDEAFINAEPTQPMTLIEAGESFQEVPEAYTEQREGTSEVRVPDAAPPAPVPEAMIVAPTVRAPGSYVGYACVWLVEDERDAINPTAATLIQEWIEEICAAHEWDFNRARIETDRVYVSLEVPTGTLPHTVVHTLMQETADRALSIDPTREIDTPWSAGYLVRTPPEYIQEQDIQRFIRFYRGTQNGS